MNMEVNSGTSAPDTAERNTNLTPDSRNSEPGGQYFHPQPNGDVRVTVSTKDRGANTPNGNRAEVHNQQFSPEQANDFESWFTVHEGHSFSVAQLLNFGVDGASPELMFTVEQGAAGQPNMLIAKGRGISGPITIGPLPADGHFGIKINYDGAGGFTAQVYTGSKQAPVAFGPPITGNLSVPEGSPEGSLTGPLQFRAGVYFHGFNGQPYPEGMEVNTDVTLHSPSTAFRMTAEQPATTAPPFVSGSSL